MADFLHRGIQLTMKHNAEGMIFCCVGFAIIFLISFLFSGTNSKSLKTFKDNLASRTDVKQLGHQVEEFARTFGMPA